MSPYLQLISHALIEIHSPYRQSNISTFPFYRRSQPLYLYFIMIDLWQKFSSHHITFRLFGNSTFVMNTCYNFIYYPLGHWLKVQRYWCPFVYDRHAFLWLELLNWRSDHLESLTKLCSRLMPLFINCNKINSKCNENTFYGCESMF